MKCVECGAFDHRRNRQVMCAPCRILNGTRVCPVCDEELPFSSFGDNVRLPDKKSGHCIPCSRRLASDRGYRKKYGISVVAAEAMKAGGCEVCGATVGLHIDHCHNSGVVRGVLCQRHNHALGNCLDSAAELRALADYAEKHAHLKVLV